MGNKPECHLYNYALTDDKTFCGLKLEDVSKATTERCNCTCRKCKAMTNNKGEYKKRRSIIPNRFKARALGIWAVAMPYIQMYLPYLVALI